MKRALLVGSTGFLGSALEAEGLLGVEITATTRNELDLARPLTEEFKAAFADAGFSYLIHAAAITEVERCFQNQEHSRAVNVTHTIELLNLALECGVRPVFFSSDYVFHGTKQAYSERDMRTPKTVYGQQKAEVENFLMNSGQDFLLLRTSKLMSTRRHSRNIIWQAIDKLHRGEEVRAYTDQFSNPACVEDVARALECCFAEDVTGIYHLGCKKTWTRYEIAEQVAELLPAKKSLVKGVSLADAEVSEPRPNINVLSTSLFEHTVGVRFSEVEEVLEQLLTAE